MATLAVGLRMSAVLLLATARMDFGLAAPLPMRPVPLGEPRQITSAIRFTVMRDFSLHFAHKLGTVDAERRVKAKLEALRRRFAGVASSTEAWSGDTATMRVAAFGQTANAYIAVSDDAVDLRVHLPALLAPLGGNVKAFLAKTGADTLR